MATFRKCSSKVSHWVEMAEAKLVAGEAVESSSLVATDNIRSSKDIHAKTINRSNKKVDRNFEEDSAPVGTVDDEVSIDDDDAFEYQPTQGEDIKSVVVKRSPQQFRSSSRIGKGTRYTVVDVTLDEGVPIGTTKVVAPRGLSISSIRHTQNTRGVDVESGIDCDDHINRTKGRRKKSKSSSIKNNKMKKKHKSTDFEEDKAFGTVSGKSHIGTTLRPNRKKSSKVSEVGQNQVSPYETESYVRIDKSLINRGDKLLQFGMNVPSCQGRESRESQ